MTGQKPQTARETAWLKASVQCVDNGYLRREFQCASEQYTEHNRNITESDDPLEKDVQFQIIGNDLMMDDTCAQKSMIGRQSQTHGEAPQICSAVQIPVRVRVMATVGTSEKPPNVSIRDKMI